MYTKDKGITVTFRIDYNSYEKLQIKYQSYKKLLPKLTFSEFMRDCLRVYALK